MLLWDSLSLLFSVTKIFDWAHACMYANINFKILCIKLPILI